MNQSLKYAIVAAVTLLALLVLALVSISLIFDPNDYKPLLIKRMQQDRQRTLAIPGDIKLTLFPRIGVQLGAVSLSEHGSADTFASLRSARVSLALWPLLRRQVVVDKVEIDGLRAQFIRFADGHTSLDDLTGTPDKVAAPASAASQPAPAPSPLVFDVAGIELRDASITYDDRAGARRIVLSRADIETGRIAPGAPGELSFKGHVTANQPHADTEITLKTGFLLDPAQQHYGFSKLSAEITGQLPTLTDAKLTLAGNADVVMEPLALDLNGIDLTLRGKHAAGMVDASVQLPRLQLGGKDITAQKMIAKLALDQGARSMKAQVSLPSFSGSAQAFKLPAIEGEASFDDGPTHAKAHIGGAIEGDVGRLHFSSTQTTWTFEGRKGDADITGTLATPWVVDLKAQTIDLAHIAAELNLPNPAGGSMSFKAQGSANLRLDHHTLDARLAGKLDESSFELKLGMASFAPAAYAFDVSVDRINADRYRSGSNAAAKQSTPAAAAPELPLDLSALRDLDARGSLRVGALQLAGVKASKLRLDLRAAGGKLDLSTIEADLYQGHAAGSLSLAATTPPRLVLKQTLSGVAIGPLLKDALGKDPIDGRGSVVLDVNTQGATVSAFEKALAGSARLELRDGAVRGFNIAQAIRSAKAKLGGASGQPSGTGSTAESTDFSELTASFAIAHGVAHNDDLLAKSPLLRITGNGDVDLGESRLDYLVKAAVVGTLQGQGGPELQALRGQTVPVRLKGPFSAIGYSIDFAGLAQEAAKQKLDEKTKDLKTKAQQQLGDKLKGLLGK